MGGSESTPQKSNRTYPQSILKNPAQPTYAQPYPGVPPQRYADPQQPQYPGNPYAPQYGHGVIADNKKIHSTPVPRYINGQAFSQLRENYVQNQLHRANQYPDQYDHLSHHEPHHDHSHHDHHHHHGGHHLHDRHQHHHHHHRTHLDPNDHRRMHEPRPLAALPNRKDAGVGNDHQTTPVKNFVEAKPIVASNPPPPTSQPPPATIATAVVTPRVEQSPHPSAKSGDDLYENAPNIRSVFIPRSANEGGVDYHRSEALPVAQRIHSLPTSSGPKWYEKDYDQRVKPLVLEDL